MRAGPMYMLVLGGMLSVGSATGGAAASQAHGVEGGRVAQARKAVASHAAEVAKLQRQVAEQEARSRQASQRLREQDRALERLHRELKAAGVSDDAVATGP